MFADYAFYKDKYYGNVISEEDFPRLSERASDKLDYICMNRISERFSEFDETLLAKVKKAVCRLAEVMKDIEDAEKAYRDSVGFETVNGAMRGKTISSISAGAESITYSNASAQTSMVAATLTDKKAQDSLMFEVVRDYIGSTGLMSQVLR